MAITYVANRGTTQTKTASQTLTLSPTGTIAAGALCLVWTAWDNNNAGTADPGPVSMQQSCKDDTGNNIWTTLVSGQNRGSGSQNAGVHGAIHICRLTTQLTTSSVITVRLNTGNSLAAKCMSIEEFALTGSTYRWAITATGSVVNNNGTDPGSISVGSPSDREIMYLHCLAAEGPDTDAYTWDADYTQITGIGTTGGADDSNVHVRGGYRITSGLTSDTVDVTSTTADRDYWQGMRAIYEYEPDLTYPLTPVLDDFDRGNEDPLSQSGAWITDNYIYGSTPGLAVSSNVVKTGGSSTAHRGQWYAVLFDVEQEAYVTCTTAASGTVDGFGVGINGTEAQSNIGFRSIWYLNPNAGSGGSDSAQLGNGENNDIAPVFNTWVTHAASRKLGMRYFGQENVEMWLDINDGNGWQWACAFRDTGGGDNSLISLICKDQVVRVNDFGGGSVGSPPLRVSQDVAESIVLPDTQKLRVSQSVAESIVGPTGQKLRTSQVVVETVAVYVTPTSTLSFRAYIID